MNRPIKFRVYTEVSHEELGMKYLELKDVSTNYNYSLMQFTGLLDKNGKEIYESDLVRWEPLGSIWEVVFENGAFVMFSPDSRESVRFDQKNYGEVEVVGNIYENPELLEANERD